MSMVEEALRHTIDAAKRRIAELEARLEVNKSNVDGIAARDETIRLLEAEVAKYKRDGEVAWLAYEQLRELMKGEINEH